MSNLLPLKQAMNTYAADRITEEDLKRKIRIDTRLDFDEIGTAFLDCFSRLSPFGAGNPKPIFVTDDVEVAAAPRLLKERHIKLLLKHNGRYFDAVGWGKGDWLNSISRGSRISVAYSLQIKDYLGEERLSLILEDMRPAGAFPAEAGNISMQFNEFTGYNRNSHEKAKDPPGPDIQAVHCPFHAGGHLPDRPELCQPLPSQAENPCGGEQDRRAEG
jgi:single-stranded-DNA-specific exonuclease